MTALRARPDRSLRSPSQVRATLRRLAASSGRLSYAGQASPGSFPICFRCANRSGIVEVSSTSHLAGPNDGARNPNPLAAASTTHLVRYAFGAEQAA